MIQKRIFYFLFVLIFLASCDSNPFDVDVSKISISTHYIDFDKILSSNDSTLISKEIKKLDRGENSIITFDLQNCIGLGSENDSTFTND